MKKISLILLFVLIGLTGYAQTNAVPVDASVKFGFLSYNSVKAAMPEYAEMQAKIQEMRQQYEAELKSAEDDFNKKYEEFLDGQASYPKTILQKRQSELQELLDKNIAFKKESQKMLDEMEANIQETIKAFINEAVAMIGMERGYAFVIDTDKESVTFINPAMGEDITVDVVKLLKQQ